MATKSPRKPGKEPDRELLRLRHLLAWLPYSRKEILVFVDCKIIVANRERPGCRAWYSRQQVKAALNL